MINTVAIASFCSRIRGLMARAQSKKLTLT
jgi:hypothetical protein